VDSVLKAASAGTGAASSEQTKPLQVLLCAESEGSHIKPGRHDYPLWRERWQRLLGMAEHVTVESADVWPTPEQWRRSDVVVMYSNNNVWAREANAAKIDGLGRDLDTFLARGGGLVILHFALNGGAHAQALANRIGLAWPGPPGKFRHNASDWVIDRDHPITAGFNEFKLTDESYWNLAGDLKGANARVLATSVEEGAPRPQIWTRESGKGRVFVSIPGHYTWTFDDPLYRILIFRGMMWTARQPIDRLAPLVGVGARITE
jgi:trehalose utilization protein